MVVLQAVEMSAVVLAAATVSGATGLAFPLIAGPALVLEFPVTEAVAITALCSLTGQIFSATLLSRHIAYEFRVPMIAAGLLGVLLGSALLCKCDVSLMRTGLGILIVVSTAWALFRPRLTTATAPSHVAETLVGFFGGVTGGFTGASSVVPAIWCATRGWEKEQQRAALQPFIMAMQAFSLLALAYYGEVDRTVGFNFALLVIPVLVGVSLGVACFNRMSNTVATRAVMGITAVTGLALLVM